MMIWTEERRPAPAGRPMRAARQAWADCPAGVFATTRVATSFGWRQVSGLVPGDLVLTLDEGMQPLAHVRHFDLDEEISTNDPSEWPVFVPAGALGNASDMIVMPGQSVLVESALAQRLMGQRSVLIRAADLDSVAGIFRVAPNDSAPVACLEFEDDQVVFGAGGALFHCRGADDLVASRARGMYHSYRLLTSAEADLVLSQDILPAGAGMVPKSGPQLA